MTQLNYDAQGFIEGIKEQTNLIHDDTTAILAILQNWQKDTTAKQQVRLLRQIAKQPQKSTADGKTLVASKQPIATKNTQIADKSTQKTTQKTVQPQKSTADGRQTANRDEKGRFAAKADETAFVKKLGGELGKSINRGGINADTSRIDPIIDSARELGQVLSPMAKIGGIAGSATINVVKQYRAKRREPLPIAQDRHNRKVLAVLDRIAKSGGGSGLFGGLGKILGGLGGGGLLGSLLGKVFGTKSPKSPTTPKNPQDPKTPPKTPQKGGIFKNLLKGGGKALGALGTLLGVGMLAKDWGGMTDEQKGAGVGGLVGGGGGAWAGATGGAAAGAALGSVVPVVGTAAGAVVGGGIGMVAGSLAGSTAGEYLGRKAYPQLKAFGSQMTEYGLPQRMQSGFIAGLSPLFVGTAKIVRMMSSGVKGLMERASGMLGGLDGAYGGGAYGTPTQKAEQTADYALANAAAKSLSKCALYVNNAMRQFGFQASGHGKDVADNLDKLNPGKFDKFTWTADYVPQIGDVMSMPSHSGSKHSFGHVAIYTKDGWVSDYKQGHKYGNSAAANAQYDAELRSGRIKGTIVRQKADGSMTRGSGGTVGNPAVNHSYDHLIAQSARKYGLPPEILKSLINTESTFNPNARSGAGAMGLTQLMPETAKSLGVANPYDAAQSIDGGAKYLSQLVKRYNGDYQKALAAYNWGMGNVDKAVKAHGANWLNYAPKETINHAKKTLSNASFYGRGMGVGTVLAAPPVTQTPSKPQNPLTPTKKTQPAPVGPVKSTSSYADGQKKMQQQIFGGGLSQNLADLRLTHSVTGGVGNDGVRR